MIVVSRSRARPSAGLSGAHPAGPCTISSQLNPSRGHPMARSACDAYAGRATAGGCDTPCLRGGTGNGCLEPAAFDLIRPDVGLAVQAVGENACHGNAAMAQTRGSSRFRIATPPSSAAGQGSRQLRLRLCNPFDGAQALQVYGSKLGDHAELGRAHHKAAGFRRAAYIPI